MVMNSPDETIGELFDRRCVCRLHIGRGTAKFARMLAEAPSRQRAVRMSVTNKGAPGILLAAISGNDFLDKNFFRPDLAGCTFVVLVKLFDGIAAPGLCACSVEEVFLNGRLDCQRQSCVERWELIRILWIKCLRARDVQCLSQVISLLLVPSPLDALPFSRGNLKESGELGQVARERSDCLVPSWDQNPAAKVEAPTDVEHIVDGSAFVKDVGHANDAGCIPGETRNAGLIVNNIDGNASTGETA